MSVPCIPDYMVSDENSIVLISVALHMSFFYACFMIFLCHCVLVIACHVLSVVIFMFILLNILGAFLYL